ncbi:MAG TPA: STAS domain-containing protein [Planctomycetes bacterium]|nr:STAS domain-containing protein [Planctomycetota bacterium]HIN81210.1 STAS domain-containing protein [Planctomycetota bacterium]
MSDLNITCKQRVTSGSNPLTYTLVRLDGFIDAPNYPRFEKTMERLVEGGRHHLILDFRKVQYINSTGISAIIRFHSASSEAGGQLALARVGRNVGLTMHLLGITSIVPFLRRIEEAEAVLNGEAVAEVGTPNSDDDSPLEVPVIKEDRRGGGGTVAMLVPEAGHFSEIVRTRVRRSDGQTFLSHSTSDLLANVDRWRPDLVVIDQRVEGSDRIVEEMKVEGDHALASVILIYPRGSDTVGNQDFRVWENDYLIDPFDLSNLFVLTDNEVRRVSHDRKQFTQQVRFQFASSGDAIDKGLRLSKRLIDRLPMAEADRTALIAAFKEAIDNAVRHGNGSRSEAKITVNYVVDPRRVAVVIEDEGDGFDYEYFIAQIDSKEAFERAKERIRAGARGGLGILLMHKCSDRLEYHGKGNIVRLEKRIGA